MNKEDIKNLSIVSTHAFPLMIPCKQCGSELESQTEIDCKVLTYELELMDGRKSQFTRSYEEPVGRFYDWIIDTVLPEIKPVSVVIPQHPITREDLKPGQMVHTDEKFTPLVDPQAMAEHFAKLTNAPAARIEREDIVKVTNLVKDIDGNVNEELTLGREYRVQDIIKKGKEVFYYEILDDEKKDMMRIQCWPSEIELVKKHIKPPPRGQFYETMAECSNCSEKIVLTKDIKAEPSVPYEAECPKCGTLNKKSLT